MAEKELELEGARGGRQEAEGHRSQPHNLKGRLLPAEQRITKKDTDDPFLGQPESFSHQFLPSTGAVLNDVRDKQMKNQQRDEDGKFSRLSPSSGLTNPPPPHPPGIAGKSISAWDPL